MNTQYTKRKITIIILLTLLSAICIACSDNETSEPNYNYDYDGLGAVSFSYTHASVIKQTVIETIIYDQGGNQIYYEEWDYKDFLLLTYTEDQTVELTEIPAGPNHMFVILGKNENGVLISYAAQTPLAIAASQTTRSVHMEAQAFFPSMLYPDKQTVYTIDTLPSFSWEPLTGAAQYRVCVYKLKYKQAGSQDTLIFDEIVNTNSFSSRPIKTHEIFNSRGELKNTGFTPFPDTGQNRFYNSTSPTVKPLPGEDYYGQDAHYQNVAESYSAVEFDGTHFFRIINEKINFRWSVQAIDQWGNTGAMTIPNIFSVIWRATMDQATGLIWEVKTANDNSIHDKDKLYTWEETTDFINQLNAKSFCGHQDWRLPTIKELNTLSISNGLWNAGFFPNNSYQTYRSSTTLAYYNTQFENYISSWNLDFSDGTIMEKNFSLAGMRVRAVRGTQIPPNFIDNGDGTITDSSSNLMWSEEVNGPMTWKEALAHCETMTAAGHDDWRLPSKNELLSIVDYTRISPADDAAVFSIFSGSNPELLPRQYWTSTTSFTSPESAYTINFVTGECLSNNKVFTENVLLRAVRSVQ